MAKTEKKGQCEQPTLDERPTEWTQSRATLSTSPDVGLPKRQAPKFTEWNTEDVKNHFAGIGCQRAAQALLGMQSCR